MKKFVLYTATLICSISVCFVSLNAQEITEFSLTTEKMVSPTSNEEARMNYNKGTELLRNNQLDEAEKYLLEAIELDPNFCDAMDHLGLLYRRQKRYDDAIEIYTRSISTNSENVVSYQNLAVVYRLQKRYEDARQMFLKIVDLDKDNPEGYYGIGQLYYDVGMYDDCITFMQIDIQKYYEQESLYIYDASVYIAHAYYAKEEYQEALKFFKFAAHYYQTDKQLLQIITELENMTNFENANKD
jgi:tetratricopeptide (TPR) repeat protein